MSASRFLEELPILRSPQGDQVGVCAMGPIGDEDELVWMRVWVWQQVDDTHVAASTGNAGERVDGAHPLSQEQRPPFFLAQPGQKWMVQTGFEQPSSEYDVNKPALAQALALVRQGQDRVIMQWGQAVKLREPHHAGPGGGTGTGTGGGHDH